MATILLEKNEAFEHCHNEASQTVLIKGQVQMIIGGRATDLQKNIPVDVPANTSHTLQNVGEGVAKINCLH